jgi:hypothetical protein
LKRRTIILTASIAILMALVLREAYRWNARVIYQGKSVRTWAAALYQTPASVSPNPAVLAFRAMGSNAVPELRPLILLREPLTDRLLGGPVRRLPPKLRTYVLEKVKPSLTWNYRLGALQAIKLLGAEAGPALPELTRALQHPDARLRWSAAQTISALGPEAIATLQKLTTHADPQVRHAAVFALGEARTNSLSALPQLLAATLDSSMSVRGSAAYSLRQLGPSAFAPTLAQSVTNSDPALKAAARRALLVILPPAPGLPPPPNLSSDSAELRRLTLLALGRSRLTNEYAQHIYQAGFNDENPVVRETAHRAWALATGTLSQNLSNRPRPESSSP